MTTDKQIAANQTNGAKSMGPVTDEGKASSRRNALKHGLTAEKLLLAGEDSAVFNELQTTLIEELSPNVLLEMHDVQRIASLIWRQRRIPAYEAALISWLDYRQHELHDRDTDANGSSPDKMRLPAHGALNGHEVHRSDDERLQLGRMLEAALSSDLMGRLGRHEAHIARQFKEALEGLRALLDERDRKQRAEEKAKKEAEKKRTPSADEVMADIKRQSLGEWPETKKRR
jgi:hypothetical protein